MPQRLERTLHFIQLFNPQNNEAGLKPSLEHGSPRNYSCLPSAMSYVSARHYRVWWQLFGRQRVQQPPSTPPIMMCHKKTRSPSFSLFGACPTPQCPASASRTRNTRVHIECSPPPSICHSMVARRAHLTARKGGEDGRRGRDGREGGSKGGAISRWMEEVKNVWRAPSPHSALPPPPVLSSVVEDENKT